MSIKTWETLFQLSNFMKYLASDVIPLEASPPSAYVLNSLFDLLNVTLQTIQVIKKRVPDSSISVQKNFHEQLESHASQALRSFQAGNSNPSETNKTHEKVDHANYRSQPSLGDGQPESFTSEKVDHAVYLGLAKTLLQESTLEQSNANTFETYSYPSSDCTPAPGNPQQPETASSEQNPADIIKRLHPTREKLKAYISKIFINFDHGVHIKRLNGAFFCHPCQKFGSCPYDWEKHSSDQSHVWFMGKKNWEALCNYCHLIIVGSKKKVELHMRYHSLGHETFSQHSESFTLKEVDFPKTYVREESLTQNVQSKAEKTVNSFPAENSNPGTKNYAQIVDPFHEQLESHASKALRILQAGNSNPSGINKTTVREESPTQKNQDKAEKTVNSFPVRNSTPTGAENYAQTVAPEENLNKTGVFHDNGRRGSQTSDEVVLIPRNASIPSGDLASKSLHSVETDLGNREKPKTDLVHDRLKAVCSGQGSSVVIHQSLILKKNFIFLNEQVFSGGETFGSFCLPCDKCFFDIEDWNSHSESDPVHLERITKGNYEGIVCQKCAFIVFGSFAIGSVYFDYHCKLHTDKESNVEKKEVDKNNAQSDVPNKGTLKESFIKFNNKVHTERIKESFFCHPCDQFGFDASEWKNHMVSRNHLQRMANTSFKNVEAICDHCSLRCVILNIKVDPCMSHHALGHSQPLSYRTHPVDHDLYQDLLNQEGVFEVMKPQACQDSKATPQQQNMAGHNEKPIKNDDICKSPLTESFINFDKKIHSEKIRDAFYCHPCDKFSVNPSVWEGHMSAKLHLKKRANQKLVEAVCYQCNLACILLEKDVATCMNHHCLGHNPTSYTSREQLTGLTNQQDKLDPLKPDIKLDQSDKSLPENKLNKKEKTDESVNNEASDETSILQEIFLDLNLDLLEKRIQEAFFCYPCEAFGSDWEKHSSDKSHVLKMNKKTLKALCSYCPMIFVGRKKIVEQYMSNHAVSHEKPMSITLEKMDQALPKTLEQESTPEQSTANTSETYSYPSRDCAPGPGNPQQPETASSVQNPADIIKQLHLTRKKLKLSGREPHFGGYCIPCQLTLEDAFDWMDHLDSAAHGARVKPGEKEIIYNEYSLSIFGNKNNIPDIS